MNKKSKIYIAGHRGMVGSAIHRKLLGMGYTNIITRTSSELDLRIQETVNEFFEMERPDYVFLAAAKVGGIWANQSYPADFIYQNIVVQSNVIHSAYATGVKKLLFLGSSCIYPKLAPQPMKEEYLLTGLLEHTNEPYAIAKIAGIKMCDAYRAQYGCNFISVMPTNLYGPNDNYDLQNAHVLPTLIRKFHEAKQNGDPAVTIWGTGTPMREFLHADDLADACCFLMENYNQEGLVNIGTGEDVTITQLALLIKEVVGYEGDLIYDASKPDGTPRKLMDVSKLTNLGWKYSIELKDGLKQVYNDYKNSQTSTSPLIPKPSSSPIFSFFTKKTLPSFPFHQLKTDVHSHLIPGIDDGSPDPETSIVLLKGMIDLGYENLTATPHVMEDMWRNNTETITNGFAVLKKAMGEAGINNEVRMAAEYLVDGNFTRLLEEKSELLTIQDNKVLIEISFIEPPRNLKETIFEMLMQGYHPVFAHPERYNYYYKRLDELKSIRDAGCIFQSNILSFSGYYGPAAQQCAEWMAEKGMVDLLGSDLHHERHLDALRQLKLTKALAKVMDQMAGTNNSVEVLL